ncbi:protein STRUBBELIG-RECEPTOR FAMILY 6-like isoform X1 [Iris pallida]|uniref:Protein STRUBBELIG-RECEPTOR FAMILY 6-like isoform X1 n=1 Tax=Iris pallida TaxID=29817 RepID=A0AAX6ENK6_IRIPA|nr:protein STRUBBELIG-RECEPTOR FAMILY 6-like isoform X1 [Iris pallida]
MVIWSFLACVWLLNPRSVTASTDQSDVAALNVLYGSLNSAQQLTGWTSNSSGTDPCGGQSWKGVTCSGFSVTAIKLSGLGLAGTLAYNMNSMTSLVELDLSNNNLGNGNPIPYNLPPALQRLNLASNSFTQGIPYSISQMGSLQYLNLAHNQLQGKLTDIFGQLSSLTTMDLSFNSFTGDLPESFSALSSLSTLYLQNNQFTGSINVLGNLPLEDLNVANNRFTGWIPDKLKKINNLQTDGNSWSSGPAPPPPPYTPPPGRPASPGTPGQNSGANNSPSPGGKSGIGGGGVAGIIISIFVVGGIVAFFLVRRKKKKSSIQEHHEQHQSFTAPLDSNEDKGNIEVKTFETAISINAVAMPPAAPISLKPPPSDHNKSYDEDDFTNKLVVKKTKSAPVKATVFSVADLQVATDSFSIDNLVGEGSIGRVYRAQFSNGEVLAVKKINSSSLPSQSSEDFIEVVSDISRLRHPNLTELVGYCSEHGQHLLVYEFQKNGSLHDLLHLSDEYSNTLTWNSRVKIALGTARALEYLHEVCSPSVVHKNFKSANILLDAELNPHLSDCGLASLIPDERFQASDHNVSSGYSAPEVAMSGHYTMKSDIYSFGVVMLELLTGRKPFDSTRPWAEQSLVRWATPQLHDIDALDKMVDPALEGLYTAKSLSRFADVIALCVQPEPEFRPPMSEVVQALVRLVQRANMSKRMLGGEAQDSPRRAGDPDAQGYLF